MQEVLNWLVGRKALFVAVAGFVLSYLVTDHTLSPAVGTLIQGVLSLLGGGAHAATLDMQGANKLGFKK